MKKIMGDTIRQRGQRLDTCLFEETILTTHRAMLVFDDESHATPRTLTKPKEHVLNAED